MEVNSIKNKLSRRDTKKKNSNKIKSKSPKKKVVNKTKNLKSKAKKRTNSKNTRVTKKVQSIATKSKNIKQKILPVVVGVFLAILGGVVIVEYYNRTKIIIQRPLVGSTNV